MDHRPEHRPEQQFHERKRSLTETDIADIIKALENLRKDKQHDDFYSCRFGKVSEEDFYASVEFFKSFNAGLTSGKIVAAKTILVLLITLLFGIIGVGIVAKTKGQ